MVAVSTLNSNEPITPADWQTAPVPICVVLPALQSGLLLQTVTEVAPHCAAPGVQEQLHCGPASA